MVKQSFKMSAIGNLLILLGPMIVGAFWALFGPIIVGVFGPFLASALVYPSMIAYASWTFYGIGFLLFFIAKWSVIRKGKLVTFGSSQMPEKYRMCYKSGYVLMIIGFILTGALFLAGKFYQHLLPH